jgi:hypothetical protein
VAVRVWPAVRRRAALLVPVLRRAELFRRRERAPAAVVPDEARREAAAALDLRAPACGMALPPTPTTRAAVRAAPPIAPTAVRAAEPIMLAAPAATVPAVLATVLTTVPAARAAPFAPSLTVPVTPSSRSVVIVPPRRGAPRFLSREIYASWNALGINRG